GRSAGRGGLTPPCPHPAVRGRGCTGRHTGPQPGLPPPSGRGKRRRTERRRDGPSRGAPPRPPGLPPLPGGSPSPRGDAGLAEPPRPGQPAQKRGPAAGEGGSPAPGAKAPTAARGRGRPPRSPGRAAAAPLQRSLRGASASSASRRCAAASAQPRPERRRPDPAPVRCAAGRRRHGRALGSARAPQPGAAEAPGAAPLQRGRALAAGALAAALLGLAGGAGPAGAGPQRHHAGRPPAELPDGAAAHRLLPQRHRAVFVVLGSCIAIRLGTNPDWLFFCCFVGLFMFYSAHWQTYVSGILRFGKVDVTEVQIAITMLLLISAYCGTAIWDYKIPVMGLELKFFAVFGILCGTALSFFNYFRVIFGGGVGKNGSTIAGTSVLSPGLHIGLLIILAIMIYKKSTTQLFEKHSCLYVLTFGFVNAKISQKLVVAHMTKSEICLQDTAFIGPGLLFLDQYFNSFVDEYIVLWIALVQVVSPLSHQNNMD
uniref:Choline phosphotransferase 1 n=1 Tax=Falco tinnunculus TaxID=100819 RepID=A0A8C4U3W8_FALTI